jgi:integrase
MASKKGRRGHGEGSIYQRKSDGRWIGGMDLGYINGKRKRRVVYGKTQAEARDNLRALQRQHDDGLNLADEKQTVAQYVKRWLRVTKQPDLVDKTYTDYEGLYRVNIVPYIGHKRLDKLTPDDVQAMYTPSRSGGYRPVLSSIRSGCCRRPSTMP